MSRGWRWFIPGYLLALPRTIVGFLIVVFFYKPHLWRWVDGSLECVARKRIWGSPTAQTHGFLCVWKSEDARVIRVRLRFHERVHQWWDMIAGPLHPVLYGLLFLFIFSLQGFRDWRKAYRRNPFEKQARELAKAASEGPETWGYYA